METPQGDAGKNVAATQKAARGKRESKAEGGTDVMGFGTSGGFDLMQRAAKLLCYSTLVPPQYRSHTEIKEYGKVKGYEENPNGLSNCVVALNMAQRMRADPLMIMQNLYIVEGRPAWSSQFIIAAINSCGRYSPLRFELSAQGPLAPVEYEVTEWEEPEGGGKARKKRVKRTVQVRDQTCTAIAIEKETGEVLRGPTVSIAMAVAEGWLTKTGSKWQTMPEVMLRYRAASFFGKLYAPELLMGIETDSEVIDIAPTEWATVQPDAAQGRPVIAAPGVAGLKAAMTTADERAEAEAGAEGAEPDGAGAQQADTAAKPAAPAEGGAGAGAADSTPDKPVTLPPVVGAAQAQAEKVAAPATAKKPPPAPPAGGSFGRPE